MPQANILKMPITGKLHMGRVNEVGHKRRALFADIPAGTNIEALMEPSYWAHHARDIRPLDLIEAFCEDGSWEALFRVMFVSNAEVRLSPIYEVRHEKENRVSPDGASHVVMWKGPAMKFAVIQTDTKAIIKSGFYPRSEAEDFLANHLKDLKE